MGSRSSTRNHWSTFPDHGVASWEVHLPSASVSLDKLIEFGGFLVDSGKRHRVWDSERYGCGSGSVTSFESTARSFVEDRRLLPFVFRRVDGPQPSGVISVYRDDTIEDVSTSDVGALLSQLRPTRHRKAVQSAPPIVIGGGVHDLSQTDEILVDICLETDLWFPRVIGFLEDVPDEEDTPDWYDNSEVAHRHTPRLNAFLADVHEATIRAGGSWRTFDAGGLAANYTDQWDLGGIRLR